MSLLHPDGLRVFGRHVRRKPLSGSFSLQRKILRTSEKYPQERLIKKQEMF